MFLVKCCRQHSSLVMTIPVVIRKELGLQPGDYVVLAYMGGSETRQAVRLEKWRQGNARTEKHTGRKDKGR